MTGAAMTGDTVTRPDGRIYRSRKVIAYAVAGGDEILCGVMVLGTHDTGRAKPLADSFAAWRLGAGFFAAGPVTCWWRPRLQFRGRHPLGAPAKFPGRRLFP